jgi:hypothetical protein
MTSKSPSPRGGGLLVRSPWLRMVACLAVIGLLGACSSSKQPRSAADYAARAKGDYSPPGPPHDPWGPYITKASKRFDVPEKWIREVMATESGGRLYHKGKLVTSHAGAMGLMQVMPGTYEELRARHGLDDDPYHPHDNIMAGTAYIREMYDLYGSPGFLVAYNAGPRRFEDYVSRNRGLPLETRRYVARIGPNIEGHRPERESEAAMLAMYQIPTNIPEGPRYRGRGTAPVMLARAAPSRPTAERGTVMATRLPEPSQGGGRIAVASAEAPSVPAVPARSGFSLVSPAMAGSIPVRPTGGTTGPWAIQVGAFASDGLARAAAEAARGKARGELGSARTTVGSVKQGRNTLYRARLTGLSRDAAMQACEKLSRGRSACVVLSPDAQL